MISPNNLRSPERFEAAQEVFELINGLEGRNTAFTAVDQIRGTALAKLFLLGYAEHLKSVADSASIEDPIGVAMGDISHVAGYMITGNNPHKSAGEQHQEIIRPWTRAYEELTQEG